MLDRIKIIYDSFLSRSQEIRMFDFDNRYTAIIIISITGLKYGNIEKEAAHDLMKTVLIKGSK